ncbi:MAG: class IV adenylate cyclase [Candidatus Saccharimonadaceae bacterium]
METEIEAKWLTIDHEKMRALLKANGAELIQPERLMTRKVYDYDDHRLEQKGGWVRVRNEGDKITLSYKQLNDRTLHGTKEVNVTVDDFDKTCSFLELIGLKSYAFQETKRESWELDGTEIELDTWPWIPTFIEIEAKTEEKLKEVASKLGLNFSDALHGSVEVAYQAVYDVTEEEVDGWDEITFIDTPEWLAAKVK